jgi:hypothetical protein
MPSRPVPDPRKGSRVIDWAQSIADTLCRVRPIEGVGVVIEETPGGTIIHALDADVMVEAKTGASGIAVASSATQYTSGTVDVYQCSSSGALTSAGYTVTAWNKDTANAVGNNKHIWIAKNRAGLWCVVWEQCP